MLIRYLVETPANICKPAYLAEAAAKIAESAPDVLKLEVLEREDCEKLGMGLYLGVAECAESPPKFIHLTYTPPGVVCYMQSPDMHGLTWIACCMRRWKGWCMCQHARDIPAAQGRQKRMASCCMSMQVDCIPLSGEYPLLA